MSELVLEKNNVLPHSWTWTTINQICRTSSGGTPSRTKKEYYGGSIPWIKSGELKDSIITDSEEKITKIGLENSSTKIFPKGTVLLALYGATTGKTAILHIDATTNQAVCAIFNDKHILDTNYLLWYLRFIRKNLIQKSIGGAQPNISQEIVNKFEIPLPPLTEQTRIVVKIEELFSLLDFSKHLLEKTKILLKQYHYSLLKSAFEGKLTEKWRKTNSSNLLHGDDLFKQILADSQDKKIEHYKIEKQDNLPDSWTNSFLLHLSNKVVDGTHKTPKYLNTGVPFLSAKDIFDQELHFDKNRFISKHEHGELCKRCNPELGDVLLTKSGTIGRTAVVKVNHFSLFESVSLIKCKKQFIDPVFLSEYLAFYVSNKSILQTMKGVAVKHFHLEDIRKMSIPVPNLIEQNKIVEIIQKNYSKLKFNQKLLDTLIIQLNSFQKSILKQAFEGKLLPQDPNDEPAQILLEKITQEKQKIINQTKR